MLKENPYFTDPVVLPKIADPEAQDILMRFNDKRRQLGFQLL